MYRRGSSAWVQQQRMPLAVGGVGVGDDLPGVVDRGRVGQLEPGPGGDQAIEVLEMSTGVHERVVEGRSGGVDAVGLADYHARVVDRLGEDRKSTRLNSSH